MNFRDQDPRDVAAALDAAFQRLKRAHNLYDEHIALAMIDALDCSMAQEAVGALHLFSSCGAIRLPAGSLSRDPLKTILDLGETLAAESVDDARLERELGWRGSDGVTPSHSDGWREIDSDLPPTLERVIVSGWQPRSPSGTAGYWWVHEDHTDEYGRPMCHPGATLWQPMPQFPRRPGPNP